MEDIVAFLSDLLEGTDRLILVQDGVEREGHELLWEAVRWNGYHAEEGGFFLRLLLWKHEWTRDEVWSIGLNVLVEDDLIHGLGKLKVDFTEESGGV